MEYSNLNNNFTKPKSWKPGKQSFFNNVTRVPRKLKKQLSSSDLTIGQKLWNLQSAKNPNYNRFLIQKVIESQKSRFQNI